MNQQTSDPTVLRYTAFASDPAGGNPAGVVICADLLPDAEMQRTAAEVGYSETAFIAPSQGDADYDIRYFSPEREVPFCGHATIATAVALAEQNPALTGLVLATRTEQVPLAMATRGGVVTATLSSPPASHVAVAVDDLDEALGTFGWDREILDTDLSPVVASAGAHHLVLPVATRALLGSMTYDFDALRALMLRRDWTTVAVLWRETSTLVHARNPFPVGGVTEDPATGAAAAAVGGYLRDRGALPSPGRLTIVQGEDMGRPSQLTVEVRPGTSRVDVSGTAVRLA